MSKMNLIPDADYVAACNAIREKDGSDGPIKSGEMAQKIRDILSCDSISIEMNGGHMKEIFAWCNIPVKNLTVKIKNPVTNFTQSFREISGVEKLTVSAPESDGIDCTRAFAGTSAANIDLRNWKIKPKIANNLIGSENLVKVLGEIDLSMSNNNENFAYLAYKLEEIRLVPNSIKKHIELNYSPRLSDASIQSIIDGLADLSDGTAQTLTLSSDVKAKLSSVQTQAISSKNWTLA